MSCIYDSPKCKYHEEGSCMFPVMGSGYPYDAPCFGRYFDEEEDEDTGGPRCNDCEYSDLEVNEYPCNMCCQNVSNDDEGELLDMFKEAE